jgi:hypothetical protein
MCQAHNFNLFHTEKHFQEFFRCRHERMLLRHILFLRFLWRTFDELLQCGLLWREGKSEKVFTIVAFEITTMWCL